VNVVRATVRRDMFGPTPTTRTLLIPLILAGFLFAAYSSGAQLQPARPLPEPTLRDLASHLLRDKGKAGCKPPKCKILVVDFTLASGEASQLGVELADQTAKDLASLLEATEIIERARLRSYLDAARIPADLLNSDEALRWLGKELGATTIFAGTTTNQDGKLRFSARMLSSDGKWSGPYEDLITPYEGDLTADLASVDPYSMHGPVPDLVPPAGVFTATAKGISAPGCRYCPPPSYTSAARGAKFQGGVILAIVVTEEGQVRSAVVLRGAPFDLNEKTVADVQRWQLSPGTKEGQPVTVMVPIEVIYRLY